VGEDRFEYIFLRIELWILIEVAHHYIFVQPHFATIGCVVSGYNPHQRCFSGSVFGDERHFVALADVKGDVIEKRFVDKRFSEIFY
jgi:hypothetical protein